MADVVVLGSLNMDLVAEVDRLPQPGETVPGRKFLTMPGGKGANQAVAVARLGMATAMVGRVGADAFGQALRAQLKRDRIDISAIQTHNSLASGTALIAVSPLNNQIIVIPGANGAVDEDDLARLIPYFEQAKVLMLQFEIPLPVIEKAAALAYQAGLTVIVDPAPAIGPLAADFCEYISILTPNQTEAALLSRQSVTDVASALTAAEMLQQQGIAAVIVKLGELGAVCATATDSFVVPAFAVQAIDTVAAGDAFNGGLAAALCRSARSERSEFSKRSDQRYDRVTLEPAIRYAHAVGALAVTQSGAQSAMPDAAQVDAFLQVHRQRPTS